jgi:threonine/homoserine/homoserine lactone efflux protein
VAAVGTLILTVLALGLAVAFCSPVSVVTVIILLTMPAGRRRAIAFIVGWLVAIAVIGVLTVFVLHGQDFSSRKTTPSKAASAVEILVGCIILFVSARAFRRRSRAANARSAEAPKWLGRLDQTNWLLAVLLGAFMLTYSLTVAAASEILKANVSRADAAFAFGVYALASISTIVAPIVIVFVAPERSAERLEGWRLWLLGNSRTVGLVALMVIGAILVGRGIHDLT